MQDKVPPDIFKPQFNILGQEEILRIHESGLRILNQVGISIDHHQMVDRLLAAGCEKDKITDRVKIPPKLIEQSLSRVSSRITFAGYTPQDDLIAYSGGPIYVRPAIGVDAFLDPYSGERRPSTAQDLQTWVCLVNALDYLHINAPIYPRDAPVQVRDILAVEACLRWSRKPLVICAYSRASVEWMAKLVAALPRGPSPRILLVVSADSPLSFSENQIDLLISGALHGFPIILNSAGLAGATCPVTMFGCMVQMNAEALAMLTMLQVSNPGASCVYDMQPLLFDMRASSAAFGYAELGLLNAAFIEMGRSYGLVTESSGLKTDSHLCDLQSGYEKITTSYLSFLSGANLISGAGSLSTAATASPIQLIVDNELAGQLLKVSRGLSNDSMNQVEQAIARVGPRGNFLIDDHTLTNFRSEYFFSKLAVRGVPESWQARGSRGVTELAMDRMEALLETQKAEVIDASTSKEFSFILEEALRAMPIGN